MAKLTQIDSSKALTFSAYKMSPMDDPVLTDLSEKMGDHNILNVSEPIEDAEFEIAPYNVPSVLEWFSSSVWGSVIEIYLQGMAQTEQGEPLLSSWIDDKYIDAFAIDAARSNVSAMVSLSKEIQVWRSMGINQLYFDGHKLIT